MIVRPPPPTFINVDLRSEQGRMAMFTMGNHYLDRPETREPEGTAVKGFILGMEVTHYSGPPPVSIRIAPMKHEGTTLTLRVGYGGSSDGKDVNVSIRAIDIERPAFMPKVTVPTGKGLSSSLMDAIKRKAIALTRPRISEASSAVRIEPMHSLEVGQGKTSSESGVQRVDMDTMNMLACLCTADPGLAIQIQPVPGAKVGHGNAFAVTQNGIALQPDYGPDFVPGEPFVSEAHTVDLIKQLTQRVATKFGVEIKETFTQIELSPEAQANEEFFHALRHRLSEGNAA